MTETPKNAFSSVLHTCACEVHISKYILPLGRPHWIFGRNSFLCCWTRIFTTCEQHRLTSLSMVSASHSLCPCLCTEEHIPALWNNSALRCELQFGTSLPAFEPSMCASFQYIACGIVRPLSFRSPCGVRTLDLVSSDAETCQVGSDTSSAPQCSFRPPYPSSVLFFF